MSAKRETTQKPPARKAQSRSPRRPSIKTRAQAIINDAEGYDAETRHAIKNGLGENYSDLAVMVERAEAGETILDVSRPLPSDRPTAEQEANAAAHACAQRAYTAAVINFFAEAERPRPFGRSLLVVDFERDDPEAVALAVRVPGSFAGDCQLRALDFIKWADDAEYIGRILEHPDCPDSLKEAFTVIYTDLINESRVSWTTPAVLRVQLPLVLLDYYRRGKPAEADTTLAILFNLCAELGGAAEVSTAAALDSFNKEGGRA